MKFSQQFLAWISIQSVIEIEFISGTYETLRLCVQFMQLMENNA